MKKPLGMKKLTTRRTIQASTFGPHQLDQYVNDPIIGKTDFAVDVPVLDGSPFGLRVHDANE